MISSSANLVLPVISISTNSNIVRGNIRACIMRFLSLEVYRCFLHKCGRTLFLGDKVINYVYETFTRYTPSGCYLSQGGNFLSLSLSLLSLPLGLSLGLVLDFLDLGLSFDLAISLSSLHYRFIFGQCPKWSSPPLTHLAASTIRCRSSELE